MATTSELESLYQVRFPKLPSNSEIAHAICNADLYGKKNFILELGIEPSRRHRRRITKHLRRKLFKKYQHGINAHVTVLLPDEKAERDLLNKSTQVHRVEFESPPTNDQLADELAKLDLNAITSPCAVEVSPIPADATERERIKSYITGYLNGKGRIPLPPKTYKEIALVHKPAFEGAKTLPTCSFKYFILEHEPAGQSNASVFHFAKMPFPIGALHYALDSLLIGVEQPLHLYIHDYEVNIDDAAVILFTLAMSAAKRKMWPMPDESKCIVWRSAKAMSDDPDESLFIMRFEKAASDFGDGVPELQVCYADGSVMTPDDLWKKNISIDHK